MMTEPSTVCGGTRVLFLYKNDLAVSRVVFFIHNLARIEKECT